MVMPGREYYTGRYRFGYNGKEKDDEVSGTGNQYDYGFRIYNSRLGKFLSVDPLFQSYPFFTPYQYASNMPIAAKDLDGKEADLSPVLGPLFKSAGITTVTERQLQEKTDEVAKSLEKPAKISRDVIIVAGGATLVLTSGGAAIPLVSGYIAVMGGTAKFTLDAFGEYNKSDAIPTTIPSAVMVTVNYTVDKEVFSEKFMAYVDVATGVPSLDLKGWSKLTSFQKANQVLEVTNFTIDATNLAPEAKKDMEGMFQKLQQTPKIINDDRRPLGASNTCETDNLTVNKVLPLKSLPANTTTGSNESKPKTTTKTQNPRQ